MMSAEDALMMVKRRTNNDLCVEDDVGIRDLMIYTLNSAGFEAKGLNCGDEPF